MGDGSVVRLIGAVGIVALLTLGSAHVATAAPSQQQPVTICHSTGWATTPWVFMTIDEATWPEHEAHGDVRASSLAECLQRPAAQQAGQSQQAAGDRAAPAAGVETAGIQAGSAGPDVAVLPAGGDPMRPILVLVLATLGALGLSMRGPRWRGRARAAGSTGPSTGAALPRS